ncbi:MAG TPA: endolytic transglycosylase MltG, partial [Candidatus Bathyarchaeia archaeon]|nr:endolytic transglycosylase MltG [Candidatus Bathyarchaeia archaeon]
MDNQEPQNNSPQAPRRPSRLRRLVVRLVGAAVVALLLGVVAAGFFGLLAYQHVIQPGVAGENIRVTVPEGATGREVGQILAQNGLIEHKLLFRLALRLDKTPQSIKHGRYTLPKGLSALELLEMLQKGAPNVFDPLEMPDELKVTVPEGLTIAQAAQLFDNPQEFIKTASDPQLLARIGIEASSIEGFLLPNTYYFDKKPSEREVVERMVGQFKKE